MKRLALVLAIAVTAQAPAMADSQPRDLNRLPEQRVRVQAPSLGPGWHEGLFNRQRREPPCYVVIVWKPRSSTDSALQAAGILELSAVSELQVYSGPRTPMHEWAGHPSPETTDDSRWKSIPRAALNRDKGC